MKRNFFASNHFVYLTAALLSVGLSLWMTMRAELLNPDAICYLSSAEAFGQYGLKYAIDLCGQSKWPFFYILVYGFSHFTHVSYVLAAYALNNFFSLLTILFFLLIVKQLGATTRVLWLAAAVILLSHEFNSVREYIVRDHGFWAFYLLSVLLLLHFFKSFSLVTAFTWSISLLIASLFRVEGLIFLFLLPLLTFMQPHLSLKMRLRNYLCLSALTLLLAVALGGWLLTHPQHSLKSFTRLGELVHQFRFGIGNIIARFNHSKYALEEFVLGVDAAKLAGPTFLLVLISWYLLSVLSNLSIAYALLCAYAWRKKGLPLAIEDKLVLFGYLAIGMLTTAAFLAERLFLSKRYLIAMSLIFMLWVPFALNHLWRHRKTVQEHFFLGACLLLIGFSAAGGFFDFGYSKIYIREAGDWIKQNVPQSAKLYSNDYQVMYYSQHYGKDLFTLGPYYAHLQWLGAGQWKNYDYLALRLNKKDSARTTSLLQEMQLQPVRIFNNKRGDKIAIYRVNKNI